MENIIKKWTNHAEKKLKGKTIELVRYMNEEEQNDFMFHKKCLVIQFTDGTFMLPQSDDEGNDAGALWIFKDGKEDVIPTIY